MIPQFSIIVAVYKREVELKELLESLSKQTFKAFEVIIVDDGSPKPLKKIIKDFDANFPIQYLYKENAGPAIARNLGSKVAKANWVIFLDSDVIAPIDYLRYIAEFLSNNSIDFFGGSDKEHEDFNAWQKAISYAMTSTLSTGGLRGKKKSFTKFQPRSFNMGISKLAFQSVNGFSNLRIGEDPDLSMRLWENGFSSALIQKAWVYHKRRSTWQSFKKQVYNFGIARPILNKRHPQYSKLGFWFPTFFFLYLLSIPFVLLFSVLMRLPLLSISYVLPLILYSIAICVDSFKKHKNYKIVFLSLQAVYTQLFYYGLGFLKAQIMLNLFHKKPQQAFPKHFTNK